MANARSRIAKGRNFQKRVCEKFKEAFCLDEDDLRCAIGAETGEDIKQTKRARGITGLSVECKCVKSLNIWAALEQAKANCPKGAVEAVVFKRGELGSNKTYIVIPLDHYLEERKKNLE